MSTGDVTIIVQDCSATTVSDQSGTTLEMRHCGYTINPDLMRDDFFYIVVVVVFAVYLFVKVGWAVVKAIFNLR